VFEELAPLVALWAPLDAEIAAADARLFALAKDHLVVPVVTQPRSMPSIGPVTAIAFVASLDDVTRFHSAHQGQVYLGLVPSEYSAGDRRLQGWITKRGDARMRWLFVEAAWRILRSPNPELAGLKAWAEQIAHGGARVSRSLPWRAEWPGSCTQCGGTTRCTPRPPSARPLRSG
jgi:transposase